MAKVLLIAEDPVTGCSIERLLQEAGRAVLCSVVCDGTDARAAIDVVVAEHVMPTQRGLTAIRELRTQGCESPRDRRRLVSVS